MNTSDCTTVTSPVGDEAHNLLLEATTTHHERQTDREFYSPPPSKFDPQRYRKSQPFHANNLGARGSKVQTIIPVRKPSKQTFVRVHPDPKYRIEDVPTITDEKTSEIYLISSELELPPEIANKVDMLSLATSITADRSLFLWFYKNTTNSWHESARMAIADAMQRWVRLLPDRSSNGYLLEHPMTSPPDPIWPEMTFAEILERAFGSRFIESLNHPLVRKLQGDFHA